MLRPLKAVLHGDTAQPPRLLPIGRKLHPLLEGELRVATWLEGANVVEEIETVLTRLVDALLELQARLGPSC